MESDLFLHITILPFSLILLNLEEKVLDNKRGTVFWIERLIINSAEELRFTVIWFQTPILFHPSPILSGNGVITTLATSC